MLSGAPRLSDEEIVKRETSVAKTPEQVWESIVESELRRPAVTAGTGFGRTEGLRVGGRIFAMFMKGELVLKLPKDRVEELTATGVGHRFEPGHGRVMKEWVVIAPTAAGAWAALAEDARAFVSSP